MKKAKTTILAAVLVLGSAVAFATSSTNAFQTPCSTVPSAAGTDISSECEYVEDLPCCTIAAGNTAEYVFQGSIQTHRLSNQANTVFGERIN